ncbi:MAG TPA: TVP38/TMEM64 family protein [Longimicrobiales bacterium]|nr:TVP38/TMEM64 family protein [Longimicrobiales bacterium]
MIRRNLLWLAAAIVVVAVVFLLGRRIAAFVPTFAQWVKSLGPLGPLVFIGGWIVASVLMVPGLVLTLTGGALFGIARGSLYVFIGATLGATAAFIVSRYIARDALIRRFSHMPRFRALQKATEHEGRKIVFLLRLSPALPFNLLNYALGLTSVRLIDYVIGCIGMLPVIVMWVYYGRVIGDVARIFSGSSVAHGTGYWAMLALGLAATVAVTIVITRAAKRALQSTLEEN